MGVGKKQTSLFEFSPKCIVHSYPRDKEKEDNLHKGKDMERSYMEKKEQVEALFVVFLIDPVWVMIRSLITAYWSLFQLLLNLLLSGTKPMSNTWVTFLRCIHMNYLQNVIFCWVAKSLAQRRNQWTFEIDKNGCKISWNMILMKKLFAHESAE